jgi:hypothetical protein
MELARLTCPLAARERVGELAAASAGPLVVDCPDASAAVLTAWLGARVGGPLGIWLRVSEGYRAALAARDVATLAWLVDLELVVVEGERAAEQAEVVAALLSDEEVTFANAVATLRGAYNRPAPPRTIQVWSYDGTSLAREGDVLVEVGSTPSPAGEVTLFADSGASGPRGSRASARP